MTAESPPTLIVTDRALAGLAVNAAAHQPGVARLHAPPLQTVRDTARRASGRSARPARPGVDVERGPDGCVVTVRITVRTRPPVIETIAAVQHQVSSDLVRFAQVEATVLVHVVDVEP